MKACNELAKDDPYCYCIMSAILKWDSAYGTLGVGKKLNNATNSRCLGDFGAVQSECVASLGNGYFARFETVEDGIRSGVDLYSRRFRGLPPDVLTFRWAGNPQSQGYWEEVRNCYE